MVVVRTQYCGDWGMPLRVVLRNAFGLNVKAGFSRSMTHKEVSAAE
jgi:hypothetical protein